MKNQKDEIKIYNTQNNEDKKVQNSKLGIREIKRNKLVHYFDNADDNSFAKTFYRYRNHRLKEGFCKPGTVDREEITFNKYFMPRQIAWTNITQIGTAIVYEFIVDIFNEYGKFTDKEYGKIKHIIKATVDYYYDIELEFEDNPSPINFEKIRKKIPEGKIYRPRHKEYTISEKDQNAMYEAGVIEKLCADRYVEILCIMLNFSLGLRIGELASIKVSDIDFKHKVLNLQSAVSKHKMRDENGNVIGRNAYVEGDPKADSKRTIPLTPRAMFFIDLIMQYRMQKGYKDPHLSYAGRDIKFRSGHLAETINILCEAANINHIPSHRIRKTFASSLLKAGVDVANISELLGHSDVKTTYDFYILPEKTTIQEQINKMMKCV